MKTQSTSSRQRRARRILLLTLDSEFERQIIQALSAGGAIVLVTRTVNGFLDVICREGHEFDFAIVDFEDGRHGMTLLNAIHTLRSDLPVVAAVSKEPYEAAALAYANGAAACLAKPITTRDIELVIRELNEPKLELAAA